MICSTMKRCTMCYLYLTMVLKSILATFSLTEYDCIFGPKMCIFAVMHYQSTSHSEWCPREGIWATLILSEPQYLSVLGSRKWLVASGFPDVWIMQGCLMISECNRFPICIGHEGSVGLSVCKVHISATRWRIFTLTAVALRFCRATSV
jgi:hypothetical protein